MNADCQRWVQLSDLHALGEPLASADRDFLRMHTASCRECAAEAAIWRGLKLPDVQQDPEEHEVGRTLSLIAATGVQEVRTHRGARRWATIVSAGGALACAAAFVIWMRSTAERPGAPAQALAPSDVAELPAAAPSATSTGPTLAGEDSCSERGGVRVCLTAGSAIGARVESAAERRLTLVRGRAALQLSLEEADAKFVVETPRAVITAQRATFSVEVSPDGSSTARVSDGTVMVLGREGGSSAARAVNAGESYRFGENAATALSEQERAADRALLRMRP